MDKKNNLYDDELCKECGRENAITEDGLCKFCNGKKQLQKWREENSKTNGVIISC